VWLLRVVDRDRRRRTPPPVGGLLRERRVNNEIAEILRMKVGHVALANVSHEGARRTSRVPAHHAGACLQK
jgi:hypothetical protein